jgi:hypothetical protein
MRKRAVVNRKLVWGALALLGLSGAFAVPANADGEGAFEEILKIMRDADMVDDEGAARIRAKYAAERDERASELPKIYLSGDLRIRNENFWFDEDAAGFERDDRHRGRYRFRLSGRADVNEWAKVMFRIGTGDDDFNNSIRSTNETFDGFFNRDGVQIDQAYAHVTPPWQGESFGYHLEMGRVPNPYVSKVGKDYMLWDSDIQPEGGSVRFTYDGFDAISLYANGGFYIVDEESSHKDPNLTAVQLGGVGRVKDGWELGARFSFFSFGSISDEFLLNGQTFGNVVANDDAQNIVEFRGFVKTDRVKDWPLLVYGTYAQNLGVDGIAAADGEDSAWGVGAEIGDKESFFKLGFGYFAIEANAFPSFFTDSDLFDGRTNRQGFTVYGSRSLGKGVDLNITLFKSEEIEDDPIFIDSVVDSDRTRLQVDLVYKFK